MQVTPIKLPAKPARERRVDPPEALELETVYDKQQLSALELVSASVDQQTNEITVDVAKSEVATSQADDDGLKYSSRGYCGLSAERMRLERRKKLGAPF